MITLVKKYDDKVLNLQAARALANDPSIDDSTISVSSKNGIVTLVGSARNQTEHRRVIEVVRRALERLSLKHDRIVDEIVVN